MSMIQLQLPEQLQDVIDRQVADGRVASQDAFLIEAARRFAGDLALEDDIRGEAHAGIADAEAGRFATINTPKEAIAHHARTMAHLQDQLSAERD